MLQNGNFPAAGKVFECFAFEADKSVINLSRKKHVKRKISGLGPRTSNSLPRIAGESQPTFLGVGRKDEAKGVVKRVEG